jgi:taurine dioxygenase
LQKAQQVKSIPLSTHTGAEIIDIDLSKPELLRDALAQYHILTIRNQHFTPAQFRDAVMSFGEPSEIYYPKLPGTDVGFLDSKPPNGKPLIYGTDFHIDYSNMPEPPKATTLYAVEIPSTGGDTEFINLHQAYDELPDAWKQRIAFVKCLHNAFGNKPSSFHPLAKQHPENGRLAIYLNPARMAQEPMLIALMQHLMHPRFRYCYQWHVNDWLIWDNRSVMHKARTDYTERRFHYRLMLK